MLREALSYPARADEETLLVGAILAVAAGLLARLGVLAALAVVPAVLLAGYALAVVGASVESAAVRTSADPTDGAGAAGGTPAGADVPPSFGDFRALAADGLRALAVAVAYLLVPAVALAVTVGGASARGRTESLATTVFVFGAGTVVLVVSLAFAYLLPPAFDLGRLRRVAGRGRYFVAWVSALVVAGVAGVALGVLASLGRPGEVAALAGGFYALVVVARLLGRSGAG